MLLNIEIVILLIIVGSIIGNLFSIMVAVDHTCYAIDAEKPYDYINRTVLNVKTACRKIPSWRLALNAWGSLFIFADGVYTDGSPILAWGVATALFMLVWLNRIDNFKK